MSENSEKPAATPKAEENRVQQRAKRPYQRPVLFVIGKIGQIVSSN